MTGKLIIFSAPSGSGKSTIINYLLTKELNLEFSISATSRAPRGSEKNGVEYYFLTPEEFKNKIANNEFLEFEEVYADRFYGTLKSEVDHKLAEGKNVVLDIDVKGGMRVKEQYKDRALAIFIQPPSIAELENRLRGRATDKEEVILQRIARAEEELEYANKYDVIIINDELTKAQVDAENIVSEFIHLH